MNKLEQLRVIEQKLNNTDLYIEFLENYILNGTNEIEIDDKVYYVDEKRGN